MGVKLYFTTVTASRKVKSQQAYVIRILECKSIKYDTIDISGDGDLREEMRTKAGDPAAGPPQLFNEDKYCGSYEMLLEAVEADTVEQFLKLQPPPTHPLTLRPDGDPLSTTVHPLSMP